MNNSKWLEPKRITGIVFLRAVGEGSQDIHFSTKIDIISSFRFRFLNRITPVRLNRAIHKNVHVKRNVLPLQAPRFDSSGQVVSAVGCIRNVVTKLVCV
jgi:hypothetical protein